MYRNARKSFTAAQVLLAVSMWMLVASAQPVAANQPSAQTQKQYRLFRGVLHTYSLQLVDAPIPRPGPHEVLVRVRAVSLNHRDLYVTTGHYPMKQRKSLVPLSDGAGEVVAIGPGVSRFAPGDRVVAIFFQNWIRGESPRNVFESALGGELDGMASQYVKINEQGLVALPKNLSYEEAATLPCAGVAAWSALMTRGHLKAGETVLLEGTGGVSIFGLQFAVAAGAKPIITSSSDKKLETAKLLGAVGTINYRNEARWEDRARALTGGVGVQHILDIGGKDTLPHALEALAPGGRITLIGGLGGFGAKLATMDLMSINATVTGISAGSRADFEAMNAFIEQHDIKPVVDRVFELQDAQKAYDLMDSGGHFGKIVIRM